MIFFNRFGIKEEEQKEIWKISSFTSAEYLTKEEFYVALRLIAYAQNGVQVNEDSIKFNLDAPFPKFKEQPLAIMPSEKAKPEVR